jgi:hypothetical protein
LRLAQNAALKRLAKPRSSRDIPEHWRRPCRYYLSSSDEWAKMLKRNSALRGRMTMC